MSRAAGLARRANHLIKAAGILWFVTAAVLIGQAMLFGQQADGMGIGVELICEDAGICAGEAEKIRGLESEKGGGVEFTVWKEEKRQRVEGVDGGRSVIADIVEINGSSELLYPGGTILHTGDTDGCLIGEETAEKLFGSRRVEGLALCCGGRELTVRGVVRSSKAVLVVQAADPDSRFTRITIRPGRAGAGRVGAEQFAAAYGLSVRQVRYDLFSGERFMEMIPGKWSDFAGWRQSVQRFGEDASLLLAMEKSGREEQYLTLYAKCVGWMTAGLCCLAVGGNRIMRTGRSKEDERNKIQI